MCSEALEGLPIDAIGAQEAVGHHGPAQVALASELTDAAALFDDVPPPSDLDRIERPRGQQPFGDHVVAELLDLGLRIRTAEAGLTEQQMGQLVQERERPRGPGIVVVDDHERGDVVRDGEAAKNLHVDSRVVAAQIALEQDEHAGHLRS